jgi:DNA primase
LKKKTAILVESAANALKLLQNGIYNVLGCFGSNLTDSQQILLERLLFRKLVIIFDNDTNKAGLIGAKNIVSRFQKLFESQVIVDISKFSVNDLSEMTDQQINELKGLYSL